RGREERDELRARGAGTAQGDALEQRAVPELPAVALRAAAQGVRRGAAPAARRAPPPHPDRGGAPRQGARAAPLVLDGGPGAREAAGGLPDDPAAHDDPARG